jgi:hypothetical protein
MDGRIGNKKKNHNRERTVMVDGVTVLARTRIGIGMGVRTRRVQTSLFAWGNILPISPRSAWWASGVWWLGGAVWSQRNFALREGRLQRKNRGGFFATADACLRYG